MVTDCLKFNSRYLCSKTCKYIKEKFILKKAMTVFHLVHLYLAYKNLHLYYTQDFKAHYNTNTGG